MKNLKEMKKKGAARCAATQFYRISVVRVPNIIRAVIDFAFKLDKLRG